MNAAAAAAELPRCREEDEGVAAGLAREAPLALAVTAESLVLAGDIGEFLEGRSLGGSVGFRAVSWSRQRKGGWGGGL